MAKSLPKRLCRLLIGFQYDPCADTQSPAWSSRTAPAHLSTRADRSEKGEPVTACTSLPRTPVCLSCEQIGLHVRRGDSTLVQYPGVYHVARPLDTEPIDSHLVHGYAGGQAPGRGIDWWRGTVADTLRPPGAGLGSLQAQQGVQQAVECLQLRSSVFGTPEQKPALGIEGSGVLQPGTVVETTQVEAGSRSPRQYSPPHRRHPPGVHLRTGNVSTWS